MATTLTKWIKINLGAIILLTIMPSPVYANIGLPMLAVVWPLFWYALIPIILIEYWVIKKILKTTSKTEPMSGVIVANVCSTFIGIPITWFILLLFELLITGGGGTFRGLSLFWKMFLGVTLGAPWLSPYESELYWMLPVACATLLIPFYFMSSWIEGKIVARYLQGLYQPDDVKKAVWKANQASYAFLYIIVICWLVYGISTKWVPFKY